MSVDDMSPGNEMIIYRRVDGEEIYGQFGWVTDLEFFDGLDEPLELEKITLTIESVEQFTAKPYGWDELQAEIAEEADA